MNRQTWIWTGVTVVAGLYLIIRVVTGAMASPFTGSGLGLWFAALLTLAILSFLAGDNPLYKFAEHLFVGVSAAYWMVTGFWSQLVPNLFGKLFPAFIADHFIPGLRENGKLPEPEYYFDIVPVKILYLLPLIFGILLLWRLLPKGAWISRWTLAFVVGITAGLRLIAYLSSDFIGQVRNTMVPLIVLAQDRSLEWATMRDNLVLLVGVISGLCYFYFSKEHTGAFGKISRVGIWTLMICFGAGFGYTVMGRVALLVGRVQFLFIDWLRLASP